ncbi:MAG: FG-GAP-like repeat-containing protein, partial [Myxococcota bacterium]
MIGWLAAVAGAAPSEHEICDNGIDDDADGALDCADPACALEPWGDARSIALWVNQFDLHTTDIDHDGDDDVAVAEFYGEVHLATGDGAGSFEFEQVSAGEFTAGLTSLDVDQDGWVDLIKNYAGSYFSTTSLLLGYRQRPEGGFETFVLLWSVEGDIYDLTTGDIDGDAVPDLLVAASTGLWWFSAGPGFALSPPHWVGASTETAALADLDGDGDLDAFDAQYWTPNRGDGTFEDSQPVSTDRDHGYADAGDLDGDGDLDVAVASASADWGDVGWVEN